MNYLSFLELIHNLTLLLSVAVIFDLATTRWQIQQAIYRRIFSGLCLGVVGITAMSIPWTFVPGVVFDTRSILLGISGLFFGWLPAAIAMAMTAAFRLYQGGAGVWTGVAVIVASGVIGISWRRFHRPSLFEISWRELYVFGMAIHLAMLGLMLTLPWETALLVLSRITLPLILIYPPGTALLGMLMVNRLQRERAKEKLLESEHFAFSTIDSLTTHIAVLDENGAIIAVNKAWRDFAASNPPIHQNVCAGANYLAVCDTAQGEDQPQACAFAQGIRAVKSGEKKEFSLEYPCHSASEQRWFVGRVTRFSGPGPLRIVVAHENITERKLAEEALRLYREHLEELVKERTLGLEEKNRQLTGEIAKRKLAEEAIKESEKRLSLLKDVASAANAAATSDDVLQVAVDGIARYIDWPLGHVYTADDKHPEVLISANIWHLEDDNKYKLFREVTAKTAFTSGVGMIGRVLADKKTVWIEDITMYPDFHRKGFCDDINIRGAFGFPVIVGGRVVAVLEFFSPMEEKPNPSLMNLMDEIGIHLGIVIERKQYEKELKKLSSAVEQSNAAVVITDVKGIIQYVNPKFSELTGYSSTEAIGKNPRILNSGVHKKRFYKGLWETILSGQNWHGTFCNRRKNGELYWERASISPVRDENGEILNFVAVKEDITKLLQYEEELKHAKETAEGANKAKSDFLASMSHELRTPLNAIIGFSEVLKEQFFGPLTQKQEEYVEDILESGKYLLLLINDILDLSKVEAGRMELELSRVNISDLISSSLILIKEKTIKHNIVLEKDVGPELEHLEIMADERKLKQVLFNLLSNAAKFTPDGGSIRLAANVVQDSELMAHHNKEAIAQLSTISNEPNTGFIEISIEDTGIGIGPEHQKKVFEPFYQVSGSRQNKTPGTGLGLPLCKDLVELHGGTIRMSSEGEGKGSRFSFIIPVERKKHGANER